MYEYLVKIVPTIYGDIFGSEIMTNQFSAIKYIHKLELHGMNTRGVPGFFILYDLSPIIVEYEVFTKSFLHFLTNLCAIVGGIYTIFSLIDLFFYSGVSTLHQKMLLGKQG